MIGDLHIPLVERRYHLNGEPMRLRDRLDALTETLLRDRLPQILAATGTAPGTICLRRLSLHLSYRPGRSDAACLSDWSAALGKALTEALAQPSPGAIVRLGSPVAAHLDIAAGLATGRLERAWAWQAAGLTEDDHRSAAPVLAGQWMERLATDPALPAVLRALIRGGHVASLRRARLLPPAALTRLGRAALGPAESAALSRRPAPTAAPTAAATRIAPALSQICGAGMAALGPQDRAAASVWAIAAAEPAALTYKPARLGALLSALAERLANPDPSAVRPRSELAATAPLPVAQGGPISGDAVSEPPLIHGVGSGRHVDPPEPGNTGTEFRRAPPQDRRAPHAPTEIQHVNLSSRGAHGGRTMPNEPPAKPDPLHPTPAPDSPAGRSDAAQAHRSPFAGLVLWLNAFPATGIVEALAGDQALTERPFGWRMAGLVEALLPIRDDDPALAVLADRAPDDPPWSEIEPAATELERAALEAHAHSFATALAGLLPDRDPEVLAYRLAAQPGRIDCEPGWITFALPLDSVATDLRQAGLDLHPGFVPWLGAVLRISYEDAP